MKTKQKIIVTFALVFVLAVAVLLTAFFVDKADKERYSYKKFLSEGYTLKVFVKVENDYVNITEDVCTADGVEFEDGYVYRVEIYSPSGEMTSAEEVDLKTKEIGLYGRVKNFGLLKTVWILIGFVALVGGGSYLIGFLSKQLHLYIRKKKKQIKVE